MVHYSSDAVFELTIRMLLFFPPEELLAMFQHGITPTVLTVPVAYVGS
jgi:23S rRNA maturation mini-RNase III